MIYWVLLGVTILLFVGLIGALRKGVIETKYSILWFFTCIVFAAFSLFDSLIEQLAKILGVFYAPSVLFMFGILFLLMIVFDLTRRISKMNKQLVTLIQEHALLVRKIQSIEEENK